MDRRPEEQFVIMRSHIFKVRENALRFALCGRMHVPSKEQTTMIHDAR